MGRETIRIRDLANPVLTDLQRQAVASAPLVTMTDWGCGSAISSQASSWWR